MIGTREEAQQLIRSKVIGANTLVWKKCVHRCIGLLSWRVASALRATGCASSALVQANAAAQWAERGGCRRSFGAWEHLEDVIDQLPGLSLA